MRTPSHRDIPAGARLEPQRPGTRPAYELDAAVAARAVSDVHAGFPLGTHGVRALQRTVGNRAASVVVQRQRQRTPIASGTSKTTKFLRIRVTGQASARWRSASGVAEKDARNEKLALDRAEAVKELIAKQLEKANLSIPVEFDVTAADDEHQAVTVGAHGEGSREALEHSHGDRTKDEERYRRVDVEAELVTTEKGVKTVKLPPKHVSAKTRDWLLTVTSFRELAVGGAWVRLELEIKNPITGRVATGMADLYGGGLNVGIPSKTTRDKPGKSAIGKPNTKYRSDSPIGFADFDGRLMRMERAQAVLGIGRKALWLVFLGLSKTPTKIQGGWSFGKPALGGYVVTGRLYLDDVPSDYFYVDAGTATDPFKTKSGWGESLQLTFKTGEATVRRDERDRLEQFVETWARRFR